MVMETPSPQCVGLEFVRQYYTVLNKAPMHLHRFFSHNSSFMHGGHNTMSEPIIGQADIHKMIMSLNFRDCHAKIRMVDAQSTLNNGVVIQVTGELSNNGNPMRRFMQTFVLAPQTPKKYYVHNDIFRYQDEVFSEEEGGDEAGSEVEEEIPENALTSTSFTTTVATVNGSAHPSEPDPTPPVTPQSTIAPALPTPPPVVPVPAAVAPVPAVTPVPAEPLKTTTPEPLPAEPAPEPTPPPEKEEEEWQSSDQEPGWGSADAQNTSWDDPTCPKDTNDVDTPLPASDPVQQPSEPKTFANLFKGSGGFVPSAVSSSLPVQSPPSQPPQPSQPPAQQPPSGNRIVEMNRTPSVPNNNVPSQPPSSVGGFNSQRPPRTTQGNRGGPPRDRPYRPSSEENADFDLGEDRRRAPPVPDSQQIFVGNLPHAAGEEELRSEFSKFGKIVDIRINTAKGKTGPKGQVPNFGFITFEEEIAVNRALSSRPIHLHGEHRLNVEEKKARLRMDGGGMGRPNSGRGAGGMRQGPVGGLQGRGGGRGGFNRDNNRGGPGGPRGGFGPRR